MRHRSLRFLLPTLACTIAAASIAAPAAQAVSPDVVISQVYGGGGGSSPTTYCNDHVEIFNRGGSSASLTGKSVQYGSTAGNFGAATSSVVTLSGSIPAGGYRLV